MGRLAAIVVAVLVALGSTTLGLVTAPVVSSETSPAAGSPSLVQPRLASFDDTYVEAAGITVSEVDGDRVKPPALTLAIDETDDTVYVANYNVGTVEVLAPGQVEGVPVATVQVKASGDARLAGIAVDSDDDTIFVTDRTENLPKQIWAINGRTLTVDDTVSVPCTAGNHNGDNNWEIAVNSRTNTLYVPCFEPNGAKGRVVALNTANLDDSSVFTNVNDRGYRGIAIDPTDDTVFIAAEWGPDNVVQNLAPANPSLAASPLTLAGEFTAGGDLDKPMGVTVLDDTLYVTNMNNQNLVAINPASGASVTKVLPDDQGTDVAAFAGRDLLFVTSNWQNLWILSAPDLTLRQSFSLAGFRAWSVVVSSRGIAYVGSKDSDDDGTEDVKVFGPVTPPTGVTGLAGYEQVSVTWAQPVVAGQWYRVTASPGGKTCISQAPETTCVVGGLTAGVPYTFTVQAMYSTGNWGPASSPSGPVTPLAPPNPGPGPGPIPTAPGVPVEAAATAGNERARVSWLPPTHHGSSAITVYRVTSVPGGETCFVDAPATSCTVRDLTNGVAYSFRVQALNDGGWSPSATTTPVTPYGPANVTISLDPGERTSSGVNDVVSTRGETSGIPAGARLTPYVKLARGATYKPGRANVRVSADGSFSWTREVRRSKPLFAYMVYENSESNTVIWVRLGGRAEVRGR